MSDDFFECGCEPVDVTSSRRPDTGWTVVDANGHEHRWYVDGKPAMEYDPTKQHETPTLIWVKDYEELADGEDDPVAMGHLECRQCGEHITPQYTADTHRRYIPGSRWFRINGEYVSPEEYERRANEANRG